MSEALPTVRSRGRLIWSDYEFKEVGDLVPMHVHGPNDCHMLIVLKGSVRVHGDGWEMILQTGERCIFEPGQRHEIVALESGTKTMHPLY